MSLLHSASYVSAQARQSKPRRLPRCVIDVRVLSIPRCSLSLLTVSHSLQLGQPFIASSEAARCRDKHIYFEPPQIEPLGPGVACMGVVKPADGETNRASRSRPSSCLLATLFLVYGVDEFTSAWLNLPTCTSANRSSTARSSEGGRDVSSCPG